MEPVATTLVLQGAFVLLAFGWRTLTQYRTTGSTGFVAHRERGPVAKAAGLALTLGLLAVVAGTLLADARDWDARAVLGVLGMFAAGSALAVPTAVTVGGLLLATVGIVAQVLLVEEPHLRRQHGPAYDAYVSRSGRFLPRPARAGRSAA